MDRAALEDCACHERHAGDLLAQFTGHRELLVTCTNWDGARCYGGYWQLLGYEQVCYALPAAKITIDRVDVENDILRVVLQGPPVTAQLRVELVYEDPDSKHAVTYVIGQRQAGLGSQSFTGWRQALPEGRYFEARAYWTDDSARRELRDTEEFDVLGLLEHTVYTTPREIYCTGAPARAYMSDNNCQPFDVPKDFIQLTVQNGTGIRADGTVIKFDNQGSSCQQPSYKTVDVPRGGSGMPLTVVSVAGRSDDLKRGGSGRLKYEDAVLILGMTSDDGPNSLKWIHDACPACNNFIDRDKDHTSHYGMDNYDPTITKCSENVGTPRTYKTIRLSRAR